MLCSDDKSHYRQFEDVLGTATNVSHMPSTSNETIAKVAEEQQGCQNKFQVGQNARSIVCCYECQKPRCIYSKKTLTTREERALKRIQEKYK
ncbi:hypothetical protein DPMN_152696 [Dreissena polymorpha]|uniref:Uncharacterized protein n=2 Tax=Dreissena polymorpha TaxID=45954 RepID=A0A9D4FKV7_DREPO|nr:hypothetical protein DPMN_152696 [Dreissena polymorpha]